MKKAAILAAALAMVLTLAACGNRDDNDSGNQPNDSSVTDNNGVSGSHDRDDPAATAVPPATAALPEMTPLPAAAVP